MSVSTGKKALRHDEVDRHLEPNAIHFSDADPGAGFYRTAAAFKQTEASPNHNHGLFEQRLVAKEARIESDITVGCIGRDCQSG